MFLLILAGFLTTTNAANVITVYGDVYENEEFFSRTYPWIIDNIGGELTVEYFMLGSGKYSVPQMCALEDLRENTFLQAQYLKCEAEGYPSDYCLCETGIDPTKFKQCVASGGHLASAAAANYSQLGVDFTPIIALGPQSTVFEVEDSWYLKKICTIFGNNLPRGCIKPFDCDQSETFSDKKALAHFDRRSVEDFPVNCGPTEWPTKHTSDHENSDSDECEDLEPDVSDSDEDEESGPDEYYCDDVE